METDDGRKPILIILLMILFTYNAFKFIEEGGSTINLTNILFNMIILVACIIIALHKNELVKKCHYIQKKLDDYFK